MPAKVTVQSGISAGAIHWIERPVIRVGSDPQSDICLPSADVPSHAFTLEYRDGFYRVYNRSRADFFVGQQLVSPGQGLEWLSADLLQLNDIELVLELDADPTPRPVLVTSDLDVEQQQAGITSMLAVSPEKRPKTDEPSGGSKTALQIAVIVLCVLGSIGLMAREQTQESSRPVPPRFATVVRAAMDSTNTSPELIQRLQYAESAVIRGNRKAAQERFGALRDDLIPQKNQFISKSRIPELAVLNFVEYRLGQLD